MIITKIRGGLGNQLFTYAAGRALALAGDVPLVLDISWYEHGQRQFLLDRFAIAGEISARDWSGVDDGVGFNQQRWNYDPSFEKVTGDRFLSGWWQSERFFEAHAPVIRRDVTLLDEGPRGEAEHLVAAHRVEGGRPLVSLHCRRGDYVELAAQDKFTLLDRAYYETAMARFPEGSRFVVFSDDPAWCRDHLEGPRVVVSDVEDPIVTFAAMQLFDHHIISNSTFSWWAAWVAERPDSTVVAPCASRWFGPVLAAAYDTSDIIPPRWVELPVDGGAVR